MREAAAVFNKRGEPIFWLGGAGASIQDSRELWDVLWANREDLGGVVHTHPWEGSTGPSGTDVTTFAAIEKGLGKRLLWPIVTMTHEHFFVINPVTGQYVEARPVWCDSRTWVCTVETLRLMSQGGERG